MTWNIQRSHTAQLLCWSKTASDFTERLLINKSSDPSWTECLVFLSKGGAIFAINSQIWDPRSLSLHWKSYGLQHYSWRGMKVFHTCLSPFGKSLFEHFNSSQEEKLTLSEYLLKLRFPRRWTQTRNIFLRTPFHPIFPKNIVYSQSEQFVCFLKRKLDWNLGAKKEA